MTDTPAPQNSDVICAIIVAAAQGGVIGAGNALPWHIPEDLRYFKRMTLGKPIVMGRKTFDSIGKPLPGRSNIVVSRQRGLQVEGVSVVASVEEALALGEKLARQAGVAEVMVVGGSEIYRQALPHVQRIYLTDIDAAVSGDAFFPELNRRHWQEISSTPAEEPSAYPCHFRVLERVPVDEA